MDKLKEVTDGFDTLLTNVGFKGGGAGAAKFAAGIGKSMAINNAGDALAAQGVAIEQSKGIEAASLRRRGQREKARLQREAIEEGKKGELVESNLIARAGASASDPGVLDLAAKIAAEADFRKRSTLAEGGILKDELESAAVLREFEGSEAKRAGKLARKSKRNAALFTLLEQSEHLSLFDKFGEKPQKIGKHARDETRDVA